LGKQAETSLIPYSLSDFAHEKPYIAGRGTDVNARDKDEETPLHYAARRKTPEITAALLKAGTDVNAENKYGKTPLHYAKDNPKVKDTDVYWKMNDARYKS
jgi:ankyrin repeat protein